jgi:hypothetical protein
MSRPTSFSEECSSVDVNHDGWFEPTTTMAKLIMWCPVSTATSLRWLSKESHADIIDRRSTVGKMDGFQKAEFWYPDVRTWSFGLITSSSRMSWLFGRSTTRETTPITDQAWKKPQPIRQMSNSRLNKENGRRVCVLKDFVLINDSASTSIGSNTRKKTISRCSQLCRK